MLSAGIIAIDLARQMLQLYPDSYALVVSTENLTYNWYPGTNRSMLVTNTIFRVGGAAMLLSNKRRDSWYVKAEEPDSLKQMAMKDSLSRVCDMSSAPTVSQRSNLGMGILIQFHCSCVMQACQV